MCWTFHGKRARDTSVQFCGLSVENHQFIPIWQIRVALSRGSLQWGVKPQNPPFRVTAMPAFLPLIIPYGTNLYKSRLNGPTTIQQNINHINAEWKYKICQITWYTGFRYEATTMCIISNFLSTWAYCKFFKSMYILTEITNLHCIQSTRSCISLRSKNSKMCLINYKHGIHALEHYHPPIVSFKCVRKRYRITRMA